MGLSGFFRHIDFFFSRDAKPPVLTIHWLGGVWPSMSFLFPLPPISPLLSENCMEGKRYEKERHKKLTAIENSRKLAIASTLIRGLGHGAHGGSVLPRAGDDGGASRPTALHEPVRLHHSGIRDALRPRPHVLAPHS